MVNTDTASSVNDLRSGIKNGNTTLFLGAGASRDADFPDTVELAKYLAKKAGGNNATLLDGKKLDLVADYLYAEPGFGKQWVREKIIKLFEQKHKSVDRPPSPAHGIMTRIRWRTLFTTNFDRLVEISYDASSESVQRVLPIYTPDSQIIRHEEA